MGCAGRVLIIVENLAVPFDRRVWQEAVALRDAGFQVSVISRSDRGYPTGTYEIDGIRVYRHPLLVEARSPIGYAAEYASAFFWQAVLLCRVWASHGIDVIHACNPPDTVVLVALPLRLFGTRFVFDHHDLSPELFVAKFGRKGLLYKILLWLERLTFRWADVTIATNESYRRIAIERGRMNPEDVFVVRNGPDLDRFAAVEPKTPPELTGRRVIAYVGVMGQQEGIDFLLEAARILVFEYQQDDLLFVLVGGGTELERLKRQAEMLGLQRNVLFTGRVPDCQLSGVLRVAEVCVACDPFNELNDKSTMNKIMEYMAFGRAVAQFDLAEGRVSAQEASLYATPDNAHDLAEKVLLLLKDDELREELGSRGRQRVKDVLAWQRQVPTLLAAYRRVLDKRGNRNGEGQQQPSAQG